MTGYIWPVLSLPMCAVSSAAKSQKRREWKLLGNVLRCGYFWYDIWSTLGAAALPVIWHCSSTCPLTALITTQSNRLQSRQTYYFGPSATTHILLLTSKYHVFSLPFNFRNRHLFLVFEDEQMNTPCTTKLILLSQTVSRFSFTFVYTCCYWMALSIPWQVTSQLEIGVFL